MILGGVRDPVSLSERGGLRVLITTEKLEIDMHAKQSTGFSVPGKGAARSPWCLCRLLRKRGSRAVKKFPKTRIALRVERPAGFQFKAG